MLSRALSVCVVVCLGAAPFAAAQTGERITWVDVCSVTAPDLRELVQAEAAMIAPGFLQPNWDGTYRLDREPFTYLPWLGPEYPLCSHSIFYKQPRPNGFPAGRSAVLVGPDLILTANHFFEPGVVPAHDFVFGFHLKNTGTSCEEPDLDHIPASDVYRAVEVIQHGGDAQDFLLLRLDRPVRGRPFVRVRRSGAGVEGDRVTVIGHPEMLPTKVDLAGTHEGVFGTTVLVDQVHTLVGSSGSMVYNRDKQLLESVVRTFSCAQYVWADGCYEIVSNCAGGPYGIGHSVSAFAEHVPAFELVVDSLADVVHVAPVGGPLPDPVTAYTISAPRTAAGPIKYQVEPPAPPAPGEPRLDLYLGGPAEGDLDPGKTLGARARASIEGVPCGRYVRTFRVDDRTHGYSDTLRHIFEIGLSEIEVSPPADLTVTGLAPPYTATATYTVRNLRPDPTAVKVAASTDWITINGVAATRPGVPVSLTFRLAPAGQAGDRVRVVIGVGGFADGLRLGHWHYGQVAFENASGACEAIGSTVRRVSFRPGLAEVASTDVPKTIPDGDRVGVESRLRVPEEFCVADLDVSIRTCGLEADDLTVDLISPEGKVVRLWDHHGWPNTDIRRLFDDDTAPAPTGELLSAFNASPGTGAWRLRLVDDVPGGENLLAFWTLTLRSSGAPPCRPDRSPGPLAGSGPSVHVTVSSPDEITCLRGGAP